jgi:hypothetical protein
MLTDRLARVVPPNPRLQRTPSAPLSRQPLGIRRSSGAPPALSVLALLGAAIASCAGAAPRIAAGPGAKCGEALPADFPVSETQILRSVVPEYESKVAAVPCQEAMTARHDDASLAWMDCYEARVVAWCRSALGIGGRDFVIVVAAVLDGMREGCHRVVIGVVDVASGKYIGALQDSGTFAENGVLQVRRPSSRGATASILVEYTNPDCSSASCSRYVLEAQVKRRSPDEIWIAFSQPREERLK